MSGYILPNGGVEPRFAQLMVALAEVLDEKLTEARIRAYARALSDVPYDVLRDGFRRAAYERQSGRFPSPGELRVQAGTPAEDAALLAWASLGRAAAEAGAYASVEFADGAAAVALEMVFGSWAAYCETAEGPALGARRQEFLAAYREARRRGRHREPARMLGLCEAAGESAAATWLARVALDGAVNHQRGASRLAGAKPAAPALGDGGTGGE